MKNTIGIRREDLSKKGEQRVPLTPRWVQGIVKAGHTVLVQPGMHPHTHELKRAHRDAAFAQAGAHVQEDISGADVILGLKEIGLEAIHPGKVYCCFSHTHKGQAKNRPMLQAFLDRGTTLIDYELVTDAQGVRTVTAFTYYAGYAGMIDTLWTMAQRLHLQGKEHPFAAIPQAVRYDDLEEFKRLLAEVGETIRQEGTPADQPPVISLVLGNGKTSAGVQSIFNLLPVEHIRPQDLATVHAHGDRRKVYQCVMDIGDLYRPAAHAGLPLAAWESMDESSRQAVYFAAPMDFESNLAPCLPYATLLLNCVLWSPKYPRLLTKAMMAELWQHSRNLLVIGDISCDPNGAVEFSKETWIDEPVFVYDPITTASTLGMEGEGIAVMAVTNLPCEFSKDSSEQFSRDLGHLIPSLVSADYRGDLATSGLDDELQRGVILWQGAFTPRFAYMEGYLEPVAEKA